MAARSGSGAGKSERGGSKKGAAGAQGGRAPSLQEELEEAAEGVSYFSESDSPLRFFTLPAEGEQDLTPEGFLNRLGVGPLYISEIGPLVETLIEEWPLEGFFPSAESLADSRATDIDDPSVVEKSEGYRRVEAALTKHLRNVTVLRVGKVEVRCYLAGLDERGNIAGLVTTSVET